MTSSADRELQSWIDDWQAATPASTAADQIRDYVHRRSRLLRVTVVTESLIGVGVLIFLVHRVVTHSDPFEKLAMGLLAAITVGATTFGLMNWRGAIKSRGEDTATFMMLAVSRAQRLERSVRAAWWVLAAQCVVFVPWTWYRIYGDESVPPSIRARLYSWGLLVLMLSLALGFIITVRRWSRRETRIVRGLQRELNL